MPFPYAEINKERFPLVFISFTGEPSTDENFLDYLNGMKDLYSRKKDLSIIFDARKATLPSLRHQKMQAKWLEENRDDLKTHCRGTAYVITKIAVRSILKMIFSITPQPVPYKIVSNMEDAENWCTEKLAQ